MSPYTPQANAYVAARRQDHVGDLTWFEVARAYDEGMASALHNRSAAERAFEKRDARTAVKTTPEQR